ncbi:hypothetical protein ACH4PW_11110 [Streptomyces sp. NPDC017082]|uniref:hypothetical protein n=1 Tax=Streptomyces sp. NPDC017082 TaxID=3364974 RepID=UPI0037A9457D
MSAVRPAALLGVAAEAALAVPGVAALHPRFSHRLAVAAAPARTGAIPHRAAPEAGVRASRAPDGGGWRVEVRCVLAEGRRVLDTARDVHDRVAAAVLAHLTAHDAVERVTVEVTVTRTVPGPETAAGG